MTVVSLAQALGLRIVAEGVETEEQARYLTSLGCDVLQGWHIGRPVGTAAVTPQLRVGAQAR